MLHATNQAARQEDVSLNSVNTEADLVASLLLIGKQARVLLNLKLFEIDLVAGQEQMLLVLDPDEAITISEVADVLTVRPSTVSKMVDRLSEKGLVLRFNDPIDTRRTYIRLSPAGVDMQASVRAILTEFEAELIHGLGDLTDVARAGTRGLEKVLDARLRRLR